MAQHKVVCPRCQVSLGIGQALPVNLRCPKCQARFHAAANGATTLHGATAPVAPGKSRTGLLAAVFGGFGVLLVVGGGLLAYCLWGSPDQTASEMDPAIQNDDKPVKGMAFIKNAPGKTAGIGVLAAGKPDPGYPVSVAKDIASPEAAMPANQKQIDAAIEKGVAYLKNGVNNNGQFPGNNNGNTVGGVALIGLTLLTCDVPRNNSKVTSIAARVRRDAPTLIKTYEIACCIWFLDKLGDSSDHALIRQLALRLIAGQRGRGGWDYNCVLLSAAQEQELLTMLGSREVVEVPAGGSPSAPRGNPNQGKQPQKNDQKGGGALPNDLRKLPVMQFRPDQPLPKNAQGREDNSLTQFAALALWVAQKHGVPADRSLAMIEARFRQTQSGQVWGYTGTNDRADSMTCAGLIGLAVGRGSNKASAGRGDFGRDPQVEKALLYLGQRIGGKVPFPGKSLGKNQGKAIYANAWGDYYFLWSLERVAVVLDLRTIGGVDWYRWGSGIILSHQAANGSWNDAFAGPVDTCFALLFLKRGNVATDLTTVLQGLGGARDPGAKPGQDLAAADPFGVNKPTPAMLPGTAKHRSGYVTNPNQPAVPAGRRRRGRGGMSRRRRGAGK